MKDKGQYCNEITRELKIIQKVLAVKNETPMKSEDKVILNRTRKSFALLRSTSKAPHQSFKAKLLEDEESGDEKPILSMNEKNTFVGTPLLSPAPKGLRGNALKEYMKPFHAGSISELQHAALVGTLLGDATIQYNHRRLPWYKFEQKAAKKDYVQALYFLFANVVGTPPVFPRLKNGLPFSYMFRTYMWQSLDFYAKQFYRIDSLGNRRKVVPALIHRWLTPQSLAFWFMDDGSKNKDGFYLHTEGFTRPDLLCLQKALGKVFHLQVNLHKDKRKNAIYYKLYIPLKEGEKFQSIVEPFLLPCMKYKLL